MQLYEISRCDCHTTPMDKRLDSHLITRYRNGHKAENGHESSYRISLMEPKVARRENEVQASEDQKARVKSAQSGLCAETIILTMDGELPARDIAPGDRIITRDSGMAVLLGVRRKRVTCDAVQIKAGSLGHKRPPEDMLLPCGTKLLIRDWRADAIFGTKQAYIAAQDLQDGEFVKIIPAQELDVVEFIFDKPHVIYAGGLEVGCQTV